MVVRGIGVVVSWFGLIFALSLSKVGHTGITTEFLPLVRQPFISHYFHADVGTSPNAYANEAYFAILHCGVKTGPECNEKFDLVRTDGSRVGTQIVQQDIDSFAYTPGGVAYTAGSAVNWYRNGSSTQIASLESPSQLVVFRGDAWVVGTRPGDLTAALWQISSNGAARIKSIPGNSRYRLLVANEWLYVIAQRLDQNNQEIWVSDGSSAGTRIVSEFGAGFSQIRDATTRGSSLFFVVNNMLSGSPRDLIWYAISPTSLIVLKRFTSGGHVEYKGGLRQRKGWIYLHPYGGGTDFGPWRSDGSAVVTAGTLPESFFAGDGVSGLNVAGTHYDFGSDDDAAGVAAHRKFLLRGVDAKLANDPGYSKEVSISVEMEGQVGQLVRTKDMLVTTAFANGLSNGVGGHGVIKYTLPTTDLAFRESNGLVSIEAEHADFVTPAGRHTWYSVYPTVRSGFGAYQAGPNTGTSLARTSVVNSPRLDFKINFRRTGTFYLWLRGSGASSNDDAVHVGLNGTLLSTAATLSGFSSALAWRRMDTNGAVARVSISNTGVHTLNLWMSEDGFLVDKLLLTQDTAFVPSGNGPNESVRGDQVAPGMGALNVVSTATSPSAVGSTAPSMMTDGNATTGWTSANSTEHRIDFDFGAPAYMESIKVTTSRYGSCCSGHDVYFTTSSDNKNWIEHGPISNLSTGPTVWSNSPKLGTRYVRLIFRSPSPEPITVFEVTARGNITGPVPYRVDAGLDGQPWTAHVDGQGNLWNYDQNFNTGNETDWPTTAISNTLNPALYRTERWDPSVAPELSYRFPVALGRYTLRLHFAETYAPLFSVGKRVFDVRAQGALVLDNLDVYKEVGANRALVKSIPITVTNGTFQLDFGRVVNNPSLRAFELIPQ